METPRVPASAGAPLNAVEAREALAAVADDRHRVAATLRREARWYSPAYGAIVAMMLLGPAGPVEVYTLVMITGTLALVALALSYWLRTGLWPRVAGPGQVLAMVVVGLLYLSALGTAWAAWKVWDQPAMGVVVAVVVGAVAGLLSFASDSARARQMDAT